jgi:hypothetical protein
MKTSFTLIKVITATIIISFSLGKVEAQTKKSSTSKTVASKPTTSAPIVEKTTTNASPIVASKPVSKTSSSSSSNSSSSSLFSSSKSPKSNYIPQSSFGKGSFYLGGGASFAGSAVAVNLSAEYGLTNDISVGGVVWYNTGGSISVGVSANYHLSRLLNLGNIDPYIGGTAYYANEVVTTVDEEGNRVDKNGIMRVVAQVGVQYYMSPKTVAFVQYSVGVLNGGDGYPTAGIKFAF